jgi:hypothetical protein
MDCDQENWVEWPLDNWKQHGERDDIIEIEREKWEWKSFQMYPWQKNQEKFEWGKERGTLNIGQHESDQEREDLKYEMWKVNWQEKPWNVQGRNFPFGPIESYESKGKEKKRWKRIKRESSGETEGKKEKRIQGFRRKKEGLCRKRIKDRRKPKVRQKREEWMEARSIKDKGMWIWNGIQMHLFNWSIKDQVFNWSHIKDQKRKGRESKVKKKEKGKTGQKQVRNKPQGNQWSTRKSG